MNSSWLRAPATIFICSAKSSGPPSRELFRLRRPRKPQDRRQLARGPRPEASSSAPNDRLDQSVDELPHRTCVLRPQGAAQFLDLAAVDLRDISGATGARARRRRVRSRGRGVVARASELVRQSRGRLFVGQGVDEPIDLLADALLFAVGWRECSPGFCLQAIRFGGEIRAKTLNKSGSISGWAVPRPRRSTVSRRMVRRSPSRAFVARGVEQPKRALLTLEKPPPQTPQRMSPENR